MNHTTNNYLICGLEIQGELDNAAIMDGLGALQHSAEQLVLEGYRPVGGVTVVSAPGHTHLTQVMFREPARVLS